MSRRRRARKLAAGASVALATSGLSTCNHNGAVDPPPPSIRCDSFVATGMTLEAAGELSEGVLRVTIRNGLAATWAEASVGDVAGGVARPVTLREPLVVLIDLDDVAVTTGSFTLSGVLLGSYGGDTCHVTRTFTFTIEQDRVIVACAELPLEQRQVARIALVRRDGCEVELDVASSDPADGQVRWSVSGGRVLSQDGTRLRWQLPDRAGLYQAELVVDHGHRGLSFDTLALAVEPPDADDRSAT